MPQQPVMPPMTEAQQIFDVAFSKPRTERSQVYKDGVMAALNQQFAPANALASLQSPYPAGSVEFDAWHAGLNEGVSLASEYLKFNRVPKWYGAPIGGR